MEVSYVKAKPKIEYPILRKRLLTTEQLAEKLQQQGVNVQLCKRIHIE